MGVELIFRRAGHVMIRGPSRLREALEIMGLSEGDLEPATAEIHLRDLRL
jgi:hypothetical protein